MTLEISQELVTPELAALYLANQERNRTVTQAYVKRIADDILNGRWQEEGDPLKFSEQGKLIDGQHRLNAVIEADKPQKFVVVRGYKKDSMAVLDIGKARSAAHVGQITGLDMNQTHTACINGLDLPLWNTPISVSRILEIFDLYNSGIVFACQHIPETKLVKPTAPMRALIAKAFYYEDHQRLLEFLTTFCTGHAQDAIRDSSAITLRNNWESQKDQGKETLGNSKRIEWYLKCQASLNYFLKGIEIKKMSKPVKIFDRYPLPQIQKDTEENMKRFRDFKSNP